MTAANSHGHHFKISGMRRQATDAVSAYTQVKMEDAPTLLKIPKPECPDIWIRLPQHKRQNHGPVWKIQSFLLKGICTVILWQDYYDNLFGESLIEIRMGKISKLGMCTR